MSNITTDTPLTMEGKLVEIRHPMNGVSEHRHAKRMYWHVENVFHSEDNPVEFIGEVTDFSSHRVRIVHNIV